MKASTLLLTLSSLALLASCGGAPSSSGTTSEKPFVSSEISAESSQKSEIRPSSEATPDISLTSEKSAEEAVSSAEAPVSETTPAASSSEVTPVESSETSEEGSMEGSAEESSSESPASSESSPEEASVIPVYFNDEGGIAVRVLKKGANDKAFVDITAERKADSGVDYFEIELGAIVRVELSDNDKFSLLGAYVNGEIATVKDGVLEFELAATASGFANITIESLPVTPEGYDLPLVAENSDHITLTFLAEDKQTEILGGNFDQKIYILATPESDRYSVRSLTYTYYIGTTGSRVSDTLKAGEDGLFPFTMPYESKGVTESGITFTVAELDAEAYSEQSFLGTYIGVDFGSGTSARKLTSLDSHELIVAESGEMTHHGRLDYIKELRDGGEIYTTNYSSIYYGGDMILTNTNKSDHLGSPYTSGYDELFVKKINDTDPIEDYSVEGVRYYIGGKTYYVATFFHLGQAYKTGYVDVSNKTAYFGVGIDFFYGESLFDAKVSYFVNQGESRVGGFTYLGQGGVDQMQLTEPWFGVYANASHSLKVLNAKDALFDGEPYVIKQTEGNLVLGNGENKVTLLLDTAGMTFEVISVEDDVAGVPDFRGLTFSGTFIDGWDDENVGSVVFDVYSSDDSITGVINYGPAGMAWNHPFYFEASFDLASNVLTMTIVRETMNEGAVGHIVHASCETGKLTFTDNITSYYAAKNCVFTCASFVMD